MGVVICQGSEFGLKNAGNLHLGLKSRNANLQQKLEGFWRALGGLGELFGKVLGTVVGVFSGLVWDVFSKL